MQVARKDLSLDVALSAPRPISEVAIAEFLMEQLDHPVLCGVQADSALVLPPIRSLYALQEKIELPLPSQICNPRSSSSHVAAINMIGR